MEARSRITSADKRTGLSVAPRRSTRGGTLALNATDALGYNAVSAGNSLAQLTINGGTVNIAVSGNEGLTTNLTMTGGTFSSTGGGGFNIDPSQANAPAIHDQRQRDDRAHQRQRRESVVAPSACPSTWRAARRPAAAISRFQGSSVVAGIVKNGTGALTLTGTNSYTGGTSITAGTLLTGNTGTLGTGNVTLSGAGALTLGNSATIASTATLTFASGKHDHLEQRRQRPPRVIPCQPLSRRVIHTCSPRAPIMPRRWTPISASPPSRGPVC